jgi:hypothetical protein
VVPPEPVWLLCVRNLFLLRKENTVAGCTSHTLDAMQTELSRLIYVYTADFDAYFIDGITVNFVKSEVLSSMTVNITVYW